MSSKSILFIGIIVSTLYIISVIYFNKKIGLFSENINEPIKNQKIYKNEKVKFLLSLKDKEVNIISNISIDKDLKNEIDKICSNNNCKKNIQNKINIKKSIFAIFLKDLLKYINTHKLYKASIIINGKNIDINYMVNTKNDLIELTKLINNIKKQDKNISIINSSSIIEVFNIEKLQTEIENILNNKNIEIVDNNISINSKKILDLIFNKIKELGDSKIIFYVNLNEKDMEILKNYIISNYPFIINIKMIKSEKNKIEIKEIS